MEPKTPHEKGVPRTIFSGQHAPPHESFVAVLKEGRNEPLRVSFKLCEACMLCSPEEIRDHVVAIADVAVADDAAAKARWASIRAAFK